MLRMIIVSICGRTIAKPVRPIVMCHSACVTSR